MYVKVREVMKRWSYYKESWFGKASNGEVCLSEGAGVKEVKGVKGVKRVKEKKCKKYTAVFGATFGRRATLGRRRRRFRGARRTRALRRGCRHLCRALLTPLQQRVQLYTTHAHTTFTDILWNSYCHFMSRTPAHTSIHVPSTHHHSFVDFVSNVAYSQSFRSSTHFSLADDSMFVQIISFT